MSTLEEVLLQSPGATAQFTLPAIGDSDAAANFDVVAQIAAPQPMWRPQPWAVNAQTAPLEGPSTLALAIIGFGTLIAYRGIHDRLIGEKKKSSAARPTIKPRRRAA